MNIFVSTRPGDSKACGAGDVVVSVSVWASATMLRNAEAMRMYFGFMGIDFRVGIEALDDYGFA
jgi:hypothetical protein